MGHNGIKWFTFGKVGQTWSNGSHLEERVTLGKKLGDILKKKRFILRKMGHHLKDGPSSNTQYSRYALQGNDT